MNEVLGLWNAGEDRFHSRLSPPDAKRIIKTAFKKGINTFDSAYSYRDSDTILRSALNEIGAEREEWRIIEKVMPVPTMKKKTEAMLKRLGTDYIDILLIHWPEEDEGLYSSLKALEKLRENGIAVDIGVSNFPLFLLEKVSSDFDITYHERALSLIWNRDYRKEKELGIKTLAYAPLGFGILASGERKEKLEALPCTGTPTLKKLLKKLREISEKHNTTISSIAYSWVIKEEPWAVIRGVSSPSQLDITEVDLTEDEEEELTSLADEITNEEKSDNIFGHDWRGERR